MTTIQKLEPEELIVYERVYHVNEEVYSKIKDFLGPISYRQDFIDGWFYQSLNGDGTAIARHTKQDTNTIELSDSVNDFVEGEIISIIEEDSYMRMAADLWLNDFYMDGSKK